jgi:hypothetical protein
VSRGESEPPRALVARPRLVGGGVGLVFAVIGYTGAQAVILATALPDDYVLLALPVFGVVGFASLVLLVTSAVARRPVE